MSEILCHTKIHSWIKILILVTIYKNVSCQRNLCMINLKEWSKSLKSNIKSYFPWTIFFLYKQQIFSLKGSETIFIHATFFFIVKANKSSCHVITWDSFVFQKKSWLAFRKDLTSLFLNRNFTMFRNIRFCSTFFGLILKAFYAFRLYWCERHILHVL